jgi:hypothetical protein
MEKWAFIIAISVFLAFAPSASAMNLYQNTQIQPNQSASGWYVLMDASIALDELLVNTTHVSFIGLDAANQGCWNYDNSLVLCAPGANCILNQTKDVINITFKLSDTDPPDVNWTSPSTSNGTQYANWTWIEWNITSTENVSIGYIEINGTNTSCTGYDYDANSYCFLNQTGLTNQNTYCSFGWASDIYGNWNMTMMQVCRQMNYTAPYAPYVPPTVCGIEPILIFDKGIRIAWRFSC